MWDWTLEAIARRQVIFSTSQLLPDIQQYPDPRDSTDARGAMRRLLGFDRDDVAEAAPKHRFRTSAKLDHLDDEAEDDRGL